MRALRILLIGVVIGGVLLLSGIALLPLGCNTPFVKGRLNQAMLDSKQRTLSIDGDLSCSLSLAPAVDIHLVHVTLSEHASTQPFASLDDMKATLRLWPLLSGQFVLDGIEFKGLKAKLLRRRDGMLNIADLLGADKPKPDSLLPPFTIGGVRVSSAELEWQDETNGQTLTLGDLQFVTGRLANVSADALALSARLKIAADDGNVIAIKTKARYDYDLVQKRFAIDKLEAQMNSTQFGNLREAALQLDVDNLAGDAQSLKIGRLIMQFVAQTAPAGSKVTGRLAASPVFTLPSQTLELPDFSAELAIAALPPLTIDGPIRIDLARRSAAGKLSGQFDDSRIAAKVEISRFQPLSLDFAITIDKLDLDRYLPASRTSASGHASAFDVAALNSLDLRGTLDIGDLRVARAKMRNARLSIRKAVDGRLEIAMPAK